MRENPSERIPQTQWQIVTNKKHKHRHQTLQARRTCFVNFLPISTTNSEIAKIFRSHGYIEYIYIPMVREHQTHKYAFVQFRYPQSLPTAIRDVHGQKLEHLRITVHPAKSDKTPYPHKPNLSFLPPPPPNPKTIHKYLNPISKEAKRDTRSYKEVASPTPKNTEHKATHTEELNPSHNKKTLPKPSKQRIMSSRALGEDTEMVRESLGEIDIEGDFVAALKAKKCDEKEEMLQRSSIAIALSAQTSEMLMNIILSQGVNNLSISPMGGMQHLITFESMDDKEAMLESKWLDQWFESISEVKNNSSTLWRETWLCVYGVPLVAWCYENFYNIGCIFG